MRQIPTYTKQQLIAGNRNYKIYIEIYAGLELLPLVIENDNIWANSFSYTESSSEDGTFQLGAVISSQLKFTINNINDDYSEYDFAGADIYAFLELPTSATEYSKMPLFCGNILTADYDGSLISISCISKISKLDMNYDPYDLFYPTSESSNPQPYLVEIIDDIAEQTGVNIYHPRIYDSYLYYHVDASMENVSNLTCREMLSYCLQYMGGFARDEFYYDEISAEYKYQINVQQYDYNAFNDTNLDGGSFSGTGSPYPDGDDADGGDFTYATTTRYDGGSFDDITKDYLTSNQSMSVSHDTFKITGVIVAFKLKNGRYYRYLSGTHSGYTLIIKDNPLIRGWNDDFRNMVRNLYNYYKNWEIRSFDASTLSNPQYQIGDPCVIQDFRGRRFYSFITSLTFKTGDYERCSCDIGSLIDNQSEVDSLLLSNTESPHSSEGFYDSNSDTYTPNTTIVTDVVPRYDSSGYCIGMTITKKNLILRNGVLSLEDV